MPIKHPQPNLLSFRPGQEVFHEGESSQSLFLIKKGTVAIRKMKGAAQVELARVYTNEVLGELSFFDRLPRSASAVALTEVEVMEIRFDALDKIYDGVPDYFKTIVASMAERLRKASDAIRRLQKDVIRQDDGVEAADSPGPSASEVIAATLAADLAAEATSEKTPAKPEDPAKS